MLSHTEVALNMLHTYHDSSAGSGAGDGGTAREHGVRGGLRGPRRDLCGGAGRTTSSSAGSTNGERGHGGWKKQSQTVTRMAL